MGFKVVIPARYGSTRLPGKPLLDLGGRPVVWHVYKRAVASGAEQVVVATDDERIGKAVRAFGGDVCMTSDSHRSGTERLAETVSVRRWTDDAVVVNLQGDEPLIPSSLVAQVARELEGHPGAVVSTLCTPIHTAAELFDPHVVKVVRDNEGYGNYFSRAVIPWDREAFSVTTEQLPERSSHWRHLGLYAYRAGFAKRYVTMKPSPTEEMESLEQLRVLWHGERIYVGEASELPGHGIDTEQDLARARELLEPAE